MKRELIMPFAMLLLAMVFAPAVQAQLVTGPPRPDGFPQWLEDPSGLRVELGLVTRNPRLPAEAGPTLFDVAARGRIIEAGYWSAEADIVDPAFTRILLIMATEAEVDPLLGPLLANVMRFRMDPVTPGSIPVGNYTVDTPFGSFSFTVDAATPRLNVDGVDILIGRDAGGLVVGLENAIDALPVPAGTAFDGPINAFPRADLAPVGFLGDAGELPVLPEPGAPPPRPVPGLIPGPDPTGPQPLLDAPFGSTFRIHFPDGTTILGEAAGAATFSVQGQIFEDAGAAGVLTALLDRPARRGGTLTVTATVNGVVSNTAFADPLPTPAIPTAILGISAANVLANTPTVFTFAGAATAPPQRIAITPAGATIPVVAQVADVVTADVIWRPARGGILTIRARSSFRFAPVAMRPTLTAIVGGVPHVLNPAGNITLRGVANPGTVTIISSQGNTETVIPVIAR